MDLNLEIEAAKDDPQKLEHLYQAALQGGQQEDFESTLLALYQQDSDNLLYAAWHFRLIQAEDNTPKLRRQVNWLFAVPLSILTGLIFWLLSDIDTLVYLDVIPHLVLWWSPIATMSALVFLSVTVRKNYLRGVALVLGLLAAAGYVMLIAPTLNAPWRINDYLLLGAIHLPLLCWGALGIAVLGLRSSTADRFAFLIKSIEVMITAGLYLIAGVVLGGITIGMFAALGISLSDVWLRLIAAGGFGLLPVIAVASVYDPAKSPSEQDFDQGLSKFIATMMRLLLPLTLGVLAIYLVVIPFNFLQPYENRELLIVYNLMLFAIMGLLLGVTPIIGDDLSPQLQRWLRRGIITVAALAVLVSLYALSATVYRTIGGGITINRLAILGWNAINISILLALIYVQFKGRPEQWIYSLKSVFSLGTNAYLVWGLFLVLVLPLLFQ
jgi:hypothetical protein